MYSWWRRQHYPDEEFAYENIEEEDEEEEEEQEHFYVRYFLAYIIQEVALVFLYVLASFVCTWTLKTAQINSMAFARWTIEASCAPWTIFVLLCTKYPGLFDYILPEFEPVSEGRMIFGLKLFQFVIIRYGEIYPSSWLNDLQTCIFYFLCHPSGRYHIPDDHPMQFLLQRIQNSIP